MTKLKKDATISVEKEVTSNFEKRALAGVTKSETQKKSEEIKKFRVYAIIDCERQISNTESDLKEKETDVKLLKQELALIKEEEETSTYQIAANYASWVERQNKNALSVYYVEVEIAGKESEIKGIKRDLAKHQQNLAILKS